jgi:phospholipid/cholesterol/gamma-HCH transport system ATP-binding protein
VQNLILLKQKIAGKNKLDSNSPILEVKNISFKRGKHQILKNFSLALKPRSIVAIMGPSGIGKTTLLSLINAIEKPDSGNVLFQGTDMHSLSQQELYTMRKKIGYMFQHGALFTHLNVFDNVAFPLRENTDLPEHMIKDLVLLKLEAVGLRGTARKMPHELSGGMARRVALARSTALDPSLMLYDEPFTGQDPISTAVLTKSIVKMRDILNLTSVVVSHDIGAVKSIADEVIIIGRGEIIAQGSVVDIESSSNEDVMQFMQGLSDGPIPFNYPTKKSLAEDLIYA